MESTYDGIILGAGHNSLILQAYLGRAGLKTLCLERLTVPGGGLATIEDPFHPGFLHNTHSFFHRAITAMPWYADLELKNRGAAYLEPELNTALILRDGRSLQWWTEFERTADSFEGFSRKDAAKLRRWREDFLPVLENILLPESRQAPLSPENRNRLLERSVEGRLLLEVSRLSPLEFVLSEFENPIIQAGLLFINGLREVDLHCKGMGYHIPLLLASAKKAQMCAGGSAALARALTEAVEASGGKILCGVTPQKILVEHGRVCGVQTTDGKTFQARQFVASGLNPQQTFLELLDPAALPAGWRTRAEKFRYNLIAPLFALNLNLREPPRYAAAGSAPELDRALMVILGLEHFAQYPEIVRCHEQGKIPRTVMWGSCPTVFDSSQAPKGCHTAFMWEKLPYRLHGRPANWEHEKEAHGRRMLELWKKYAPNLEDAVISAFTRSPLDVARTFPNMRHGDLLIGSFSEGQIGFNRPFPGAGTYRVKPEGLYLCGSSCHPGGNITGLPAYNCAQVLLADLGLKADWAPEPLENQLERL